MNNMRQVGYNYIYYGANRVFLMAINYDGSGRMGPYYKNNPGDIKSHQLSAIDSSGAYGFDMMSPIQQCFDNTGNIQKSQL